LTKRPHLGPLRNSKKTCISSKSDKSEERERKKPSLKKDATKGEMDWRRFGASSTGTSDQARLHTGIRGVEEAAPGFQQSFLKTPWIPHKKPKCTKRKKKEKERTQWVKPERNGRWG